MDTKMHFKYPLTNAVDGPCVDVQIKNKNVHIHIFDRGGECVYKNERGLGFWNDDSLKMPVENTISEMGIEDNKNALKVLLNGLWYEFSKRYDLRRVPPGFEINKGLFAVEKDDEGEIKQRKFICYTPVWVPAQYHNVDSDNMMVDLAFYINPSKLSMITIPQKEAFQRKGIMELAAHGALLEEAKTPAMINWLVNYINYNDVPTELVFERFGWKENHQFVLGEKIISKDDVNDAKIINVPTKSISGLSVSGTVQRWLQISEKILNHDRARFKCYAACTAPLLKLLNQKSFIIHDYGESSTGKTKTSELAISIWGDPSKLVMSSFGTTVGKERLATVFTDLPILIDETQISSEEDNKTLIYLIANETGKLRGLKEGGLQDTANWKTVAFTTGEAPLTTDKSFMGMSIRVIEIYGGLGAHDKEAIDDFKMGVEECYGVIGPYVIQEILNNKDRLLGYYNRLNKKFNALAAELDDSMNGVAGRAANMFAILALGGVVFESVMSEIGGNVKPAPEICAEIYRDYITTMAQSGYATKSFNHFQSWVSTKEKYFLHNMLELDSRGPYDNYGNIEDDYIDIFPSVLKDVLEKGGFNYNRVMKDWENVGVLVPYFDENNNRYRNHTVRFFSKTYKVVRVKMPSSQVIL